MTESYAPVLLKGSHRMDDFQIENGELKKYWGREDRVVIPEGTVSIGYRAFFRRASVKEIIIPDGVRKIGISAFQGCTSLKTIYIPESAVDIGEEAFCGCESLPEITLPRRLKRFSSYLLSHCNALSRIAVPDGIETLGRGSMESCVSLKDAVIPESVTEIGAYAFRGCSSLRLALPDHVAVVGSNALDGVPVLHLDLDRMGKGGVCDGSDGVWAAAVRGFLVRFAEGTTAPMENAEWQSYIARRKPKLFAVLGDDPMLYRYLAETNAISPSRIPSMLDKTESPECRAILLDYANKRKKRKRSTERIVDDLFGLDD